MVFARFGESDGGELIAGRFGEDEDDGDAGVGEMQCLGGEIEKWGEH